MPAMTSVIGIGSLASPSRIGLVLCNMDRGGRIVIVVGMGGRGGWTNALSHKKSLAVITHRGTVSLRYHAYLRYLPR